MRSLRDGSGVQGNDVCVRMTFYGGIDHAGNATWSGFFCGFPSSGFFCGRNSSVYVWSGFSCVRTLFVFTQSFLRTW